MKFKVSHREKILVIELSGTFDFASYHAFKDQFCELIAHDDVESIEMDFSQVNYIDSSGLGILILMRERVHGVGKTVTLLKPNDSVREIMAMANLGKLFTIS